MGNQNKGPHKVTHNAVESWLSPLDSLFPLEEPETQGRPLCMALHWPGEGQCGQHGAASLTLLVQSVLVPEVEGYFSLTAVFWGSFSGVLVLNRCELFL